MPRSNASGPPPKAGLAALIAASFVIASPIIMKWEGKRNDPYYDVVGKLTVCWGSTQNVERRRYSDAECLARLREDYRIHAEGVARCSPEITTNPHVFGATTSLSFNVGVNAYCKSTARKLYAAGNFRGGCEALRPFIYAGGKQLKGLINRRKDEVKSCLEGVR